MGCRPSKQATSKVRALEQCLCSPKKQHKKHKCPSASTSDNRSDGYRPSASSGQRPLSSASADAATLINTEFPAFSTTSAVYRRSAAKTSKITLRLSCDGSTLEIEQCEYDFEKTSLDASPTPRPWSSTPNLSLNQPVGKRPNSWLLQDQYLPLRHSASGWSSRQYKPSVSGRSSSSVPSHSKSLSNEPSTRLKRDSSSKKGLVQYPDVTTRTVVVEQHGCPGSSRQQHQMPRNSRAAPPSTKPSASMPSISPSGAPNDHRMFAPSAVMEQMSTHQPKHYKRQSSMDNQSYQYIASPGDGHVHSHHSKTRSSSSGQDFRLSDHENHDKDSAYVSFRSVAPGQSSHQMAGFKDRGNGSERVRHGKHHGDVELAGWTDPRGMSRTMSFSDHLKFVSRQVEKAWQDSEKAGGLRDRHLSTRGSAPGRWTEHSNIRYPTDYSTSIIETNFDIKIRESEFAHEAITPTESDSVLSLINLGCPVYTNIHDTRARNGYKTNSPNTQNAILNKSYKHSLLASNMADHTRRHQENKPQDPITLHRPVRERSNLESNLQQTQATSANKYISPVSKAAEQGQPNGSSNLSFKGDSEKEIRERLTHTFLQTSPELFLDALPCSTIDCSESARSDDSTHEFGEMFSGSPGEMLQCPDYLAAQFKPDGSSSEGEMADSALTFPNESLSNSSGELVNCCLVSSSSTDGDTRAASQSTSSISFESATYVTEDTFGTADSSTDVDTTLVDASAADALDMDSDKEEWCNAKSRQNSETATDTASLLQHSETVEGYNHISRQCTGVKTYLQGENDTSDKREVGNIRPNQDKQIPSEQEGSTAINKILVHHSSKNEQQNGADTDVGVNSQELGVTEASNAGNERGQTVKCTNAFEQGPESVYTESNHCCIDSANMKNVHDPNVFDQTSVAFFKDASMFEVNDLCGLSDLDSARCAIVRRNLQSMLLRGEPANGLNMDCFVPAYSKNCDFSNLVSDVNSAADKSVEGSSCCSLQNDGPNETAEQVVETKVDSDNSLLSCFPNSVLFKQSYLLDLASGISRTEEISPNLTGNLTNLDSMRSHILVDNLTQAAKASLLDQWPGREKAHSTQEGQVTIESAILATGANCERQCFSQSTTCPHASSYGLPLPSHTMRAAIDSSASGSSESKKSDEAAYDNREEEKSRGHSDEPHFTSLSIDQVSGSNVRALSPSSPSSAYSMSSVQPHSLERSSPCRHRALSPISEPTQHPISISSCLHPTKKGNDGALNPNSLSPHTSTAESTKIPEPARANGETISVNEQRDERYNPKEDRQAASQDTKRSDNNYTSTHANHESDEKSRSPQKLKSRSLSEQINKRNKNLDARIGNCSTASNNMNEASDPMCTTRDIANSTDPRNSYSGEAKYDYQSLESSCGGMKEPGDEGKREKTNPIGNEQTRPGRDNHKADSHFHGKSFEKEDSRLHNGAPQHASKQNDYLLGPTNKHSLPGTKTGDWRCPGHSDWIDTNCDTAMHKAHTITNPNHLKILCKSENVGKIHSDENRSGGLMNTQNGALAASTTPSSLHHKHSDHITLSSQAQRFGDAEKGTGARQKGGGSRLFTPSGETEPEVTKRRKKKNKVLSLVKYFERNPLGLDGPMTKRKV